MSSVPLSPPIQYPLKKQSSGNTALLKLLSLLKMNRVYERITTPTTTPFLIEEDGERFRVACPGWTLGQVNLLRRALLSEIPTYCIEYVTFHTNNSPRPDELIALRLGQLVLDQSLITEPLPTLTIDVEVPPGAPDREVTSNDLRGVPGLVPQVTPLVTLRGGQRLHCYCRLREGRGKEHVKWRPVSTVVIEEEPGERYFLRFRTVGMMSGSAVLDQAWEQWEAAKATPPQL
jgi:hypothetical protein